MNDEEKAAFYADPEHLLPAGPWVSRRVRPGLRNLRYIPAECGPQNLTINTGSLPYWERNPDTEEL